MSTIDRIKLIDENLIDQLNKLALNKIQYWDLKAGIAYGTALDFTDKKSKEISSYEVSECSIRTFKNGGWGFTVIRGIEKNNIINGFEKAIKLAKLSESLCRNKFQILELDSLIKTFAIKPKLNLIDVNIEEKINIVKNHENISSNYSKEIKNTRTLYTDGNSHNTFLNSHGSFISQDLSLLRLFTIVYAQKNGVLQRAVNSVGGLGGFEIVQTEQANELSNKTASEAMALLDSTSPIGGSFTLIMDPKLTGTFIHEAFGHACEADLVLNKESLLEGRIGERIALDNINIIDNPLMGQGKKYNLPYELFGSYFIDDEGIPAQKTTLIENGILTNFLHSLETASRMNLQPNGHGRASSNTSRPQVRMGITLLEPGDWKLEEIIEDTKRGILCEDFQYGYTDCTTGNFQFKCKMSYKIENGEKKDLMRDVALSGMTLEVLNKISAIGDTVSYSDGMCGKSSQSIRVCDGGPYIRVENVTVGGLN